ncbi:MAG: YggT family protein [Deltaproteobacteria bacterium]|nr:YggT family protein [Deltaproteobacteria bacterium]
MLIIKNFLLAFIGLLDVALWLYMWTIIFRAVISWVNPDPYNKIVIFLYRITEPVLQRVRRFLPINNIGIDLSPLVILAVIYLVQNVFLQSLRGYVQLLG